MKKDDETRVYRKRDREDFEGHGDWRSQSDEDWAREGRRTLDDEGWPDGGQLGWREDRDPSRHRPAQGYDWDSDRRARDLDLSAYEEAQRERFERTRRPEDELEEDYERDRDWAREEERGRKRGRGRDREAVYADFTEPIDLPKKKKRRKRHFSLGKLILTVLILLIVFGLLKLKRFDLQNGQKEVVAEEYGNTLNPIGQDMIFLLAGVDDTGAGTPQRTDTLMIFRLNFETGQVSVLSVPRDTRAPVRGKPDKINHAHAYGGINLTLQTIRNFLNLDLDYYMKVDYETVKAVIDAGGGVYYDVPATTKPEGWETFTTGPHRLDGAEALSYLRHRKSYAMGDIGRVQAQQAFMKEAIHQLISPKNAFRYPAMARALMDHADTNIPTLPLLRRLPALAKLQLSDVDFRVLPGEGRYIGGLSYYVTYPEQSRQMVSEMFGPFLLP